MLNRDNREKISVIIDFPFCPCDELSKPIMTLYDFLMGEDEKEYADSLVIPPSLNDSKWRELEKNYKEIEPELSDDIVVNVINANEFLRKNGFDYKADFWRYEIRPEDFEGVEVTG